MTAIAPSWRYWLRRLLDLGTAGYTASERRRLNILNATAGLIVVATGFAVVAFADVVPLLCLGAAIVARGPLPAKIVDQLEAYCRKHLTPHKVPQHWFVADDLPTTPTGKVRKFALPDLIAQGSVRELSREEPEQ